MHRIPSVQHSGMPVGQPQHVRNRLFWISRALRSALALIVCLGVGGATYQVVATAYDRRSYPPPGQMVDVGGYSLHLYCTGAHLSGRATIILEPGGGGTSLSWFLIQPELAKATQVCSYDRAGQGWSAPGPEPRDGDQIAKELHTLLHNANISGPYLLVGHSYGGLFVRAYAAAYPDDVAGLVLLDSAHPDQWTRTPDGRAQYANDSRLYGMARVLARLGVLRIFPNPLTTPPGGLAPQQAAEWQAIYSSTRFWDAAEAESRGIPATMAQVRGVAALSPSVPLLVVSAGEHTRADAAWATFQHELAALAPSSRQIVIAGATHQSLWAEPQDAQASVAAIRSITRQSLSNRSKTP
jgi:pimeloyl-ACP methyl ester carboxylesterase